MATKPSDTVPIWASNANWSAGPSTGSPTKADPTPYAANGHIEGVATPSRADVMNGWQNPVSKWCQWVQAGSSAGAADAHIVETASDGTTNLKGLVIDGTGTAAVAALYVTQEPTRKGIWAASAASTVVVAHDTLGIEVSGNAHGIVISSGGDFFPLTLTPQTTAPTTLVDGAMYFQQSGSGATRSFDFQTAYVGVREHIPTYSDQFVALYSNPADTVLSSASYVNIVNNTTWRQRKAPQTIGLQLLWTFSCKSSGTPGDVFEYEVRNGSSVMQTGTFITAGGAYHIVRGIYTGNSVGTTDQYNVRMRLVGGAANIGLSNIVFDIHTAS